MIPLPRSQQAVGRQVRIFMVNNTDYPEEVPAHTVVGVGSLTAPLNAGPKSVQVVGKQSSADYNL